MIALFKSVVPVPSIVSGTWQLLNKYLFKRNNTLLYKTHMPLVYIFFKIHSENKIVILIKFQRQLETAKDIHNSRHKTEWITYK